jgi:RND family efflux transporter MFP subunit
MHPFIIADKPGNCPICGMALTKIEGAPAPAAGTPATAGPPGERKLLFYRNPMNPMVTSPVPAKDEMGMDYVPVYEDETKGGAIAAGSGAAPAGYATITVGTEQLKVSGIQGAPAVRETMGHAVRTVGIVVPDETRVRKVQTKVEGYVEKLSTNFTGQVVRKGQPLLTLYSPELLSTQQEYLKARETAAKFSSSGSEDVRSLGNELLQAARHRLELYDVPPSFIAELDRSGRVRRTVTLNAPVSGYATSKDVYEGMKVMPGQDLFTVTDLSRVWIEADLYESEAKSVRLGQAATLTTTYDPGKVRTGRVAWISPSFSPESRTLKVRFEFPNPGMSLKPQMFADVSLDLGAVTGVTIPDSAVIDSGTRKIVFVEREGGVFEPREVRLGIRADGKALVMSGVKEGERVAIGANFLLDSESKLRSALTRMTGGTPGAPSAPAAGPKAPPAGTGHEGHGGAR